MSVHPEQTIAAIRGATTVSINDAPAILEATTELLEGLLARNGLAAEQIVSVIFTVTPDLDADFPAHAARRMGWDAVPMLCAQEIPVPGALARVVRVLLTVRTNARPGLQPVYLRGAAALRPDLATPAAGPERRIAIVGLGQIGGSAGLALRGRGWRRVGFDLDGEAIAAALETGAIDAAAPDPGAACRDAELALIAVPLDAMPGAVEQAAAALPRGAALLDTGSARGPITPALEAARRRGIDAVGGHPLAGSEGRGFAAARSDLFRGSSFALLPGGAAIPPIVEAFVRDLGARPLPTDAAAHDHALARSSHLPYLLSCALRDTAASAAAAGLAGPGLRGMTRLAASDPRMAEAYCRANAVEVAAAWVELRMEVDRRVARIRPDATGA
jgi:monofunctional chorismate mutase